MRLSPSCILCTLSVLFGCGGPGLRSVPSEPNPQRVTTASAEVSETKTIGYLVTRRHRIELLHGIDGPSFTVRMKDRSLVSSNLREADFAAQFPALHKIFQSGYANPGSSWAGLDESPDTPGTAGR